VALIHPVRAAILRTLADHGEQSAERIWAALPEEAYPDVVYHLSVLKAAELVVRDDGGIWRLARPTGRPPDSIGQHD
jgi:DNA-binding transcriptional ArsR family regulator